MPSFSPVHYDAKLVEAAKSRARVLPDVRGDLVRLRKDFPFYAERLLKIRTKSGEVQPFRPNRAQLHIHARLEEQKAKTGKVRALLLKARQQGGSTYVQGRFYHRVSGEFGKLAFILTHEDKATQNIFSIGKRYHDMMAPELKPRTKASNANELAFDLLGSGYVVATAKSKDTGRSFTAQYFHGSEVAFWANAPEHLAGIGQTVPQLPGTEIILESTANGVDNIFHTLCMKAMRGESEYILIFTPWFWSDEYRRPAPEDWRLENEDELYAASYGLDRDQMYWRYLKIRDDFQGDLSLFAQEYPANITEAFLAGTSRSLIGPLLVQVARDTRHVDTVGAPILLGVDPAEYGDDATAIVLRQGRLVYPIERHYRIGTMETVGRVAKVIERLRSQGTPPDAVFVDVTGIGSGVADRLAELGYGPMVIRVHFGGKPNDPVRFRMKRDECWGLMKDWLEDTPCRVPDDDILQSDLTAPQYGYDSSRRMVLESKEKMRQRGVSSPDSADALALTFAFPVLPKGNLMSALGIERAYPGFVPRERRRSWRSA